MPIDRNFKISRRQLLATGAGAMAGAALPGAWAPAHAAQTGGFQLNAAAARARLLPEPYDTTAVWCYDGVVPGPEIRVRQGDRIRVEVGNGLDEATTVHWHGVRVPNAMDGVANLTQAPIESGGSFVYEFDAVDAGTFWYHPHHRSSEQVGRGLYGPLIVEEQEPIRVDRDLTWVLDDWRVTETGQISDDFGNWRDTSHNGRIGNAITINGQMPDSVPVRGGERVRLRLINAANARIFGLDFADHAPTVIALDGQPVAPHAPDDGLVVLGPGMRADLVIDMAGAPESRSAVVDRFYEDPGYRLVEFAYAETPLRDRAPDWPLALPANPLPEPDLDRAERHEIVFSGGMMAGMVMNRMAAEVDSAMRAGMMTDMGAMGAMAQSGMFWFINGMAYDGHPMEPVLTLARDSSHVLAMTNITAWHHPMHLHGHSFRVIARDGVRTARQEWQDTVLVAPGEQVDVALVADNPGDWMFHCHILEHQASGMTSVIRVA